MGNGHRNPIERTLTAVLVAAALTGVYALWTRSLVPANLAVVGLSALVVAGLFTTARRFPRITPKRILYSILYLFYLLGAIVRSNLDVALRVVRPRIPIDPGIVAVTTRLRSPMGRTVLANSITLTPGTLSVEIRGDRLYIHWIDVAGRDGDPRDRPPLRAVPGGHLWLSC